MDCGAQGGWGFTVWMKEGGGGLKWRRRLYWVTYVYIAAEEEAKWFGL